MRTMILFMILFLGFKFGSLVHILPREAK